MKTIVIQLSPKNKIVLTGTTLFLKVTMADLRKIIIKRPSNISIQGLDSEGRSEMLKWVLKQWSNPNRD